MRRTLLVLGLIAIGALVFSGCGEDDSTADTTAAITKAALIKKADAICVKTSQELTRTAEDFSKEKGLSAEQSLNKAQVGELTELALPPIVRQFEEIRDLDVPAGDEEKVNAILSAAEGAIEEAEDDSSVIYGADGGAFAKTNRLSAEYGMKKCSE
jgi:hypothetical protein